MEVWGPVIVGSVIQILATLGGMAFFFGQITTTVAQLQAWTSKMEPKLESHSDRLSRLEGQIEERKRAELNR